MIDLIASFLHVDPYHVQCLMPLFAVLVAGMVLYAIVCGKDGL